MRASKPMIWATLLFGATIHAAPSRKSAEKAKPKIDGYGELTWERTTCSTLGESYDAIQMRDLTPAMSVPETTVWLVKNYPAPKYKGDTVIEPPGIFLKCFQDSVYQIILPYNYLLQRDDPSGALVSKQAQRDLGPPTKQYKPPRPAPELSTSVFTPYQRDDVRVVAEWKDEASSARLVFAGYEVYGEPKIRQLIITYDYYFDVIRSNARAQAEKVRADAQKAKDEAEKAKPEPPPFTGWRGLNFGTAYDVAKAAFPNLVEMRELPFKDPTPSPNIKTYIARSPSPDVKALLVRFYRDRLFFIVIDFDCFALGISGDIYKSGDEMVSKLRPDLGTPTAVQKRTEYSATALRAAWEREGRRAALQYAGMDARLVLTSTDIETEIKKESGAK
jgi:hypothetical protein